MMSEDGHLPQGRTNTISTSRHVSFVSFSGVDSLWHRKRRGIILFLYANYQCSGANYASKERRQHTGNHGNKKCHASLIILCNRALKVVRAYCKLKANYNYPFRWKRNKIFLCFMYVKGSGGGGGGRVRGNQ